MRTLKLSLLVWILLHFMLKGNSAQNSTSESDELPSMADQNSTIETSDPVKPSEEDVVNENATITEPHQPPVETHTNETTPEEHPSKWSDICKPVSYKDLECYDCEDGECTLKSCRGFQRPVCVTYEMNTNFKRSFCADDSESLEADGGENSTSCRKCYTKKCNDPRPRTGYLFPHGPYNTYC